MKTVLFITIKCFLLSLGVVYLFELGGAEVTNLSFPICFFSIMGYEIIKLLDQIIQRLDK